ncbi:MAG: DUF6711 family protein [Coprobacillaceae bacterium]
MDVLKVNGITISNPSSLEWQESDLDSDDGSGRNQLGDMFRDRITVKRKLSATFPPLEDQAMSALLNAVSPVFFDLEYPDPKIGKRNTMNVYVSNRSVPVYAYNKDSKQWLWQGVSLEFIER